MYGASSPKGQSGPKRAGNKTEMKKGHFANHLLGRLASGPRLNQSIEFSTNTWEPQQTESARMTAAAICAAAEGTSLTSLRP